MALHVMDEANQCLGCKKPRCQQGCPIQTNIPEVIRLLKANKLDEAGRMLFENNPLTTVCSLVCNHEKQCEGHCVRGIKGTPGAFFGYRKLHLFHLCQPDESRPGALQRQKGGHHRLRPGLFASGDAVKGARTVVEAVAYSKKVAEAMHEYMQTLPPDLPDEYANVPVAQNDDGN